MPSRNDSPLLRAASEALSRSRSKINFFRSLSPNLSRPTSPSPSPSTSRNSSIPCDSFRDDRVSEEEAIPSRRVAERSVVTEEEESVSIFTNVNPFAVLPHEIRAPPTCATARPTRRHSAELRAAAANHFQHQCTADRHGKRRKSVVEIEVMADRVRSTRLSSIKVQGRRRSSTSRRRRSSAQPRQSCSFESSGSRSPSPTGPLPSPLSPLLSPPLFSPVTDRRHAFSDESSPQILNLASPSIDLSVERQTPSSDLSIVSPGKPVTRRLRPRSPQQLVFCDHLPSPTPSSEITYIESPSGVRMRYPLVFPCPPPPPDRLPSLASSTRTRTDMDDSDLETPTTGSFSFFADSPLSGPQPLESFPFPRSERSVPFPQDIPTSRTFPSLHLDFSSLLDPIPSNRRPSVASSYQYPSPDQQVLTPSTIGLFRTPMQTSRSHNGARNVFADAFGGAIVEST